MTILELRDVWAGIEGKTILKGVDLLVKGGEIAALMGPNGSGKSTTAQVIMGHPKYSVERGDILLDGESILELSPDQRAKRGLFLAFQYPLEISGVTMANFLRRAYLSIHEESTKKLTVSEFHKILVENFKLLQMDETFTKRYLNEGFSGGEKKRSEIVQLATLSPRIAILDETDSGLDIDSVRIVAEAIRQINREKGTGFLVITHYARILNYLRPDVVHVMSDGRIIASGGFELAEELEKKGYAALNSS
ncbi:MAG: Fe-S cluster assembly ATPase SufC [Nitrososphaerota archaeon]|nr:Fe-S cluster assembly ATPase SufC [Candidatus Calditenuaceae archaeon]MDW8073660.1 Fe-S cluster assembly ATPase SufC [Nitrososphaerota archaeon]